MIMIHILFAVLDDGICIVIQDHIMATFIRRTGAGDLIGEIVHITRGTSMT